MKIYLMRHGETELNIKKVYYGSTDCELTAKGREQALKLRESFFPDSGCDFEKAEIIASPLKRALDTAHLIFPDKVIHRDERLKEIDFGSWEGKSWRELKDDPIYEAWSRDWQTVAPPGGESFETMFLRTRDFCRELTENNEGNQVEDKDDKEIIIVAHKGILQALTVQLLGLEAENVWHFDFKAGSYTLIEFSEGYGVLKTCNK